MTENNNRACYRFPSVENMPELPRLRVPDYAALSRNFREALLDPKNEAYRTDEKGHPNFGAYLKSPSNEMVTWGILAVGEWLSGRSTDWISATYADFFDRDLHLYLNAHQARRVEYWYLFYANSLAGAVLRTLYASDASAGERMGQSADAMLELARKVGYDFNDQGYDFGAGAPFTDRAIFRQPDSIGGFAYNMLFAALQAGRPACREESVRAMRLYEAFSQNPWYEIPNTSAAVLTAAWLNAHGDSLDVRKIAGFLFDHENGPLQTGSWGGEEIDGLMMGWRGETRQYAMDSAYSMETLMPLQFLLPSVRYCPQLGPAVAKYLLHVLSGFQLFYARGTRPLYETRPKLSFWVPYEKLERERKGHTPAACGDFCGHRSVYGAGYLYWLEALAVPTSDPFIFAYDLSVTDWLAGRTYPVYLLRNPYGHAAEVSFAPSAVWKKLRPELFRNGRFSGRCWELPGLLPLQGEPTLRIQGGGTAAVALLPEGMAPSVRNDMACAADAELFALPFR